MLKFVLGLGVIYQGILYFHNIDFLVLLITKGFIICFIQKDIACALVCKEGFFTKLLIV